MDIDQREIKTASIGIFAATCLCIATLSGCSVKESETVAADPQVTKVEQAEPQVTTMGEVKKVGESLYRIGQPINGFAFPQLKKSFDLYDVDLRFIEGKNLDPAVCAFTTAKMFSDQIDLSSFYWNHPESGNVPLEKIDPVTYLLGKPAGLFIHFSYKDILVPLANDREEVTRIINPLLYLCNFGRDGEWNSQENVFENVKANDGRCDYEQDSDISSVFSRNYPGATLAFFWLKGELYIISASLFDYAIYLPHSVERSVVAVVTSKVSYTDTPRITTISPICVYTGSKD